MKVISFSHTLYPDLPHHSYQELLSESMWHFEKYLPIPITVPYSLFSAAAAFNGQRHMRDMKVRNKRESEDAITADCLRDG
jgi:hypothetical protein